MIRLNSFVNKSFPSAQFYLIIALFAFFSIGFFPSQSSPAQTDLPPSNTDMTTADFLEEQEEMCELKCRQASSEEVANLKLVNIDMSKPILQGPKDTKKVALTFDDGPYILTDDYIEVLKNYNVNATFFLLGVQIDKYPEKAKKIANAGFEIGTHSYGHKQLTKMKSEGIENDFTKALSSLEKATGKKTRLFRPPYGSFNDTVIETAKRHNLATILWNVDPRDWQKDNADVVARHVINHTQDGSIILLHEGRKSTLKALPKIIEGLREKDFEIVPLSELLSSQ